MWGQKTIKEWAEAVDKLFGENGISAYVYPMDYARGVPSVLAEIEWGDWKHDHARADYLVKHELGGMEILTEVYEEDGSDCYSAVHHYFFGFGVKEGV